MTHLLRPALVVAVLALAACDSTDAEFEIGGTYSGVTEDLGTSRTTRTVEVPETESGESFRFEGRVVEGGTGGLVDEVILPVSGTGTYDHPALTLTVGGETSSGTVSDDGETITLETEPGSDPAVLRRQ